jgi:hypothetical protein
MIKFFLKNKNSNNENKNFDAGCSIIFSINGCNCPTAGWIEAPNY